MKRIWVIGFIILGLMIILTTLSPLILKKKTISLSPLPEIPEPAEDCLKESIETIWDFVFKESSEGIGIKTKIKENMCEEYFAYKTEDPYLWFIYWKKTTDTTPENVKNITATIASKASITTQYANTIILLQENIMNQLPLNSDTIKLENITLRTEPLELEQAKSEFNLIFQDLISESPSESIWSSKNYKEKFSYILGEDSEIGAESNSSFSVIFKDYNLILLVNNKFVSTPIICNPNWTEKNISSIEREEEEIYYIDENECNTTENRPANKTRYNDFDNNRVIGNFTDFNSNMKIKTYINNKIANISDKFNKTKTIKLKENTITRVEFEYDFDEQPLNIKNITIQKQPSNSDVGYLIINGIEETKTLIVDRLKSKNKICIKDEIIESISDISDDCDFSKEYLINCPGNISRFACNVSDNKFIVSGLKHSAVIEFTGSSTAAPICVQNWSCANWSDCINNQQRRICIDKNVCNNNTGKPNETSSCSSSCASNWNCTSWTPEKCAKNTNQTRICNDLKKCKPQKTESIICEYKSSGALFIIILIIVIILTIIIIVFLLLKKSNQPQTFAPPTQQVYRPSPPF